jgi:gluconolactonase
MTENTRTDIEVLDPRFLEIVDPSAKLTLVADKMKFTEGPVWVEAENVFYFSDLGDSKIYRWSEKDGLKLWRDPSNKTNGATVDLEGRLLHCEHESRRVTRTEKDGSVTVLAATHAGKKLNSPNDIVVKSDGSVWFTDPPYGIKMEEKEQPGNYVYRLDPGAKEPVPVVTNMNMPNGLCFSPDEKRLYIADSSNQIHHVMRFRVKPDNTLEEQQLFAGIMPGVPDGIRCDMAGRLFSTSGDGVQVFTPEGELIGKIRTPQSAANCRFGGKDRNVLLITAKTGVWTIQLKTQGVH